MLRQARIGSLLAVMVASLTSVAEAHEGFGLNRFDPSERGSYWFSADSLDLRGQNRWALGVVADWAHEPLVLTDEEGNSFFLIHLRTEKSHLGSDEKPLLIIPGMVASVDIITGHKSVLSYLLKPIIRARAEALRER